MMIWCYILPGWTGGVRLERDDTLSWNVSPLWMTLVTWPLTPAAKCEIVFSFAKCCADQFSTIVSLAAVWHTLTNLQYLNTHWRASEYLLFTIFSSNYGEEGAMPGIETRDLFWKTRLHTEYRDICLSEKRRNWGENRSKCLKSALA